MPEIKKKPVNPKKKKDDAIKKAEKEMLSLENTPAFNTRKLAVNNWQNEIKNHKKMIDIYYLKLNQSF